MRALSKIKFSVLGEVSQRTGLYMTGLFFFLTGVSAGITRNLRAGVSLGTGAPISVFAALVISTLPFVFVIICSPFLIGTIGLCAVMVWQGLLFGCGPVMPLGLVQISLGAPAAVYFFAKGLGLSLKWCKIKRATSAMRLSAVMELLPSAFVCMLIQFFSRIPACVMGG